MAPAGRAGTAGVAAPGAAAPAAAPVSATVGYRMPGAGPPARAPARSLDSVRWWRGRGGFVAAAVILAGVGLALWALWPSRFPKVPLQAAAANATAEDPCAGRSRCVVVYMAPWCGVCKASMPLIRELSKRWNGSALIGLKPVIGLAPDDRCEAMARTLAIPSWIDPGSRLARALGTRSVPHWFVVDGAGKIRERSPGVVLQADLQIERLGLSGIDARAQASR